MDPDMQFYLESNYIKIQNVITTLKTHSLEYFRHAWRLEGIINVSYE